MCVLSEDQAFKGIIPSDPAEARKAFGVVRTCNRHVDCDEADRRAKELGWRFGAAHCYDEFCEDCFGR
jgi:hypothetical protein